MMKKTSDNLKNKVELMVSENFDTISDVVDAVARKHFNESIGFESIDKFKIELFDNVIFPLESMVLTLDTLPEEARANILNNVDEMLENTVGEFLEKHIEIKFYDEPGENEKTFKIAGLELTHIFSKNHRVRVILHAKGRVAKRFIDDTGLILRQSPFYDEEYEIEFDIEGKA